MKQKILFLSLLFVAISSNAQYSIVDGDGNVFVDGQIVEYNTVAFPDAELEFFVTNNGAAPINMRIDFVSALNINTPSGFQLCFGNCYFDIEVGDSVPPGIGFIAIGANQTTGIGNHFYGDYAGSGSDIVDYVFRFYETDGAGVDIGNALTFTYRYNPTLGLDDLNKLNVEIDSTIISEILSLETTEALDVIIYDLQGRVVLKQRLDVGHQQINMSDLSSQMYLVHFQNNRGVSYTTKVVVK
ncbi:MAG: hypothetical protein ACI9M9_000977 [Flavobacteriaceae bacterium]|jgi:hypothetical protein